MTKEQAKQAALRWLDEASVGGRPLEEESIADFKDRMDYLLDGAVAAVCGRFCHHAVYSAVCTPPRQLAAQGFATRQIWPPERFCCEADGFFSYTLEVQGTAGLTVYDKHGILETAQVDSPTGFTRLQGVLPKAACRLAVQGKTPFLVRCVGLYPDSYPPDQVPPWQPWVDIRLPEDLAALEGVQFSGDGSHFAAFSDYRKLENGVYAVPRSLKGELVFHYIRTPAVIGPDAPPDTVLDVPAAAQTLVPLRLAADVLAGVDETAVLASYLVARYNEMVNALYRRPDPDRGGIESVYRP